MKQFANRLLGIVIGDRPVRVNARLPSVMMTFALAKIASPATFLKVGS